MEFPGTVQGEAARLYAGYTYRKPVMARIDSILPTLAFGVLMPQIVLAQFAAKVAGGAVWAWVISRTLMRAA